MNDSTQDTRRAGRKRRPELTGGCGQSPAMGAPSVTGGSGRGVTAEQLATGTSGEAVTILAPGRVDVTMSRVTIEPGGSTEWHYHPGPVIGVVSSGTLTRTLSEGTVEVSGPGSTILEPAGRAHLHRARNLGTDPVELYVTYFVPEGSPLSVDVPVADAGGREEE
ncbi:cupin domain-containing protein [Streptomyces sp. 549]|uniref:cupin domain-containing protein n=1 Tax=Streptomyces sp. 549 TaxID=3049076 RepID=UPI0024C28124|nr:cupin domain-containing protein [Streptomyces sp. 549]MDK1474163.1 cupin domain-containing protein [Streptomyces sp. 549]